MTDFPKSIKNLVEYFERLPGIGPKTAVRLVFYLLTTPKNFVDDFALNLQKLKTMIKTCEVCFGVSESDVCDICKDQKRDKSKICVVERSIDLMAIEKVGGFNGIYHVLGGVINPLDHVSPDDLKLGELFVRLDGAKELIIATNPTMEGEATALYISKKVKEIKPDLLISRIGRGLPIGADIEFADQATLSRAFEGRQKI
jgi:recombination protein RecR